VGVPYLKRKLDDLYEINAGGAAHNLFTNYRPREEEPDENATATEKIMYKLKIGFRKAYPVINAAYYLSMLGFNLAYLFNKSYYHTPFDYMVGLRMRRLTEADHRAYELLKAKNRKPGLAPILSWWTMFSPKVFTRVILPKLLDSLKVLLPTSIFFLKFLEWWYASDFARQLSSKTSAAIELSRPSVPAPPPAEDKRKEASKKLVELPKDSKICAICSNEMTNPAAIQTGFVFCYPCAYRWIEEDVGPWCPITGAKLLGGSEGLRRIMV
ncbi:ubiquitin-protein ligase peroxin 12, partial [Orbilia oligospora]